MSYEDATDVVRSSENYFQVQLIAQSGIVETPSRAHAPVSIHPLMRWRLLMGQQIRFN